MGAVIITGETARKDNAEAVTKALSQYAGDFVVATAGPDLESVIAGKGAGTNVTAKEKRRQIVRSHSHRPYFRTRDECLINDRCMPR